MALAAAILWVAKHGALRTLGLGFLADRAVILSLLTPGSFDHSFDTVHAHFQHLHLGAVADPHIMVTRAVKELSSLGRVEVEEDAGHDDRLLLQEGVEEGEAVGDVDGAVLGQRRIQRGEIEPDVERAVGNGLIAHAEADLVQSLEDVVTLHLEVALKSLHFVLDLLRFEHGDSGLLEGYVGATVEVAARRAQRLDEVLGPDNPSNTPTGQSEPLGQAVHDDHVVEIDVDDIGGGRNGGSVTIRAVVVSGIKFVEYQSGSITTDILNQCEFVGMQGVTGGIARIRGQNHRRATRQLFGDLVDVDVIAIGGGQWRGDGYEVAEQAQHLHHRQRVLHIEHPGLTSLYAV